MEGTALDEINLYIALHKDIPDEVIMGLCEYTAQLEAENTIMKKELQRRALYLPDSEFQPLNWEAELLEALRGEQ